MWVLKIKVNSEKQFIGSLAIKHNVSITSYILSHYKDTKNIYLNACGFIFGEDKNKKNFIKDLMKHQNTVNYEFKNDFGIGVIKQPLYTERFWNPKIIRVDPIIINYKEKTHIWHLASFDKKPLVEIYNLAKKHLGAKIIKLKQEKLNNISITNISPNLTSKQKQAFNIAINNGYYNYPKKVELKTLAKIMNISYSTYQEHIRKAEAKIIPNFHKGLY